MTPLPYIQMGVGILRTGMGVLFDMFEAGPCTQSDPCVRVRPPLPVVDDVAQHTQHKRTHYFKKQHLTYKGSPGPWCEIPPWY